MNRKFSQMFVLSLLILSSTCVLSRADGPATQPAPKPAPAASPADDQDYVISPMRVQEMKGMTFLFVSSKTTLAQLGDQVRQSMDKIRPLRKSGDVKPAGPALIIFHGVNQDPSSEFPLEVGFPVADETKAPDGFEVKKLDTFRCATVLYSGSNDQIHHAYEKVYNDLISDGLEPTDEGRQSILLFEGPESVNNVAMIQVGVK